MEEEGGCDAPRERAPRRNVRRAAADDGNDDDDDDDNGDRALTSKAARLCDGWGGRGC
jgi:hypothetical protein